MAEDMDLLNKAVILRILTETTKSEDRDRRRQSFNAYQVYSGNQKVYIERELQRTRPRSWQSYTLSNISVSKMVTDKRAQSYNERPIRSIDGHEEKTNNLADIYEEAKAARELQFHDTIFNLNRYDLMWVNYREQEKKFQFMCLQPYEFIVVRDKDTGELLIVGLNYPNIEMTRDAKSGDGISDLIAESQADSAAEGETWVFWSAHQHVKVRTRLVKEEIGGVEKMVRSIEYDVIEGNANNVNPLGVLPFVLTTNDTAVDYPTVNPITEQSVTFNAQQSETLTAKNIHGSGIQVFKYPKSMHGKFSNMSHGQTQAINLPQSEKDGAPPTEFEYKTSGAQLVPMIENDMNYLKQILREHEIEGVNMELGETSPVSGVSRAIAGSSVQKVIEKNQQIYADTERQMFEVIKAWDIFNSTRMFSPEDELQIVFTKPKVMVSDRETLENIKLMLELGVIEEWEKFVKMDPNLSEEAAKEKQSRIDETKQDKVNSFLGGMNGNQQVGVNKESEAGPEGLERLGEEKS